MPRSLKERIGELKKSKYCQHKEQYGNYDSRLMEEEISKLKLKRIHPIATVINAAHRIGTLPSLLYHEYFKRMINGIHELDDEKMRKRAIEFNVSEELLRTYHWRAKAKEDYAPRMLELLLEGDELKSYLYEQGIENPGQTMRELRKKGERQTNHSPTWVKARFSEFIEDPHLKERIKYTKPPEPKTNISKTKTLFDILDEAHAAGDLYDEDGNVNSVDSLKKYKMDHRFSRVQQLYNWHAFEDAVRAWELNRRKEGKSNN